MLSALERQEALTRYLEKYLKRGYILVSRTPHSAQLNKAARFPAWLFREESRFLRIDETGTIHIEGK